jgi:hypothetical protein
MKKFHTSLLLLLVLALGGQGLVANAVPCQMPSNTQTSAGAADMTGMDHTMHHMSAVAADAAGSGDDCCESGECSMSHCQSSVMLPLSYLASRPEFAPEFSRPAGVEAPAHISDSLYRPPISR